MPTMSDQHARLATATVVTLGFLLVSGAASRVKRGHMEKIRASKSVGFGGMARIATAIGALAIRQLAIGRISVGRAEFESLAIQDLTVTRLRVAEVTVTDSLKLPGSNVDRKILS